MYNAYIGRAAADLPADDEVHYSNNYENAFWDGAAMTFGDGASTFYPLVSLDVSSHEVSHGFTEQNSNLVYSAQSGGMNEAYSDMAGEAAEYFMNGSNDCLVGAQIFKGNGALRYMDNPPQDGSSIDHASQLHQRHGRALLVRRVQQGVLPAGDQGRLEHAEGVPGLRPRQPDYWTPSSTFNRAPAACETAATDLGFTKADVTAAFTSVGVSCSGGGGGGTTDGPLTKGVPVTGIGGEHRQLR